MRCGDFNKVITGGISAHLLQNQIMFFLGYFFVLQTGAVIKELIEINIMRRTEKNIAEVTGIRQKYRNKLRNCTDEELIKQYKTKRDECTTILNKYRKNLKTANYILEDTPKVKEVIKIEQQMKREQEDIAKTKRKDKYIGR